MPMNLEPKIRIGEVLVGGSMLIAAAGFAYSVKIDIAVMSKEFQLEQRRTVELIDSLEKRIEKDETRIDNNDSEIGAVKKELDKHRIIDEDRWDDGK